jgi:hypothetical protein
LINVAGFGIQVIELKEHILERRRTMKFLTISKMKDSAMALPPNVLMSIMEASLAAMAQQKKEGKITDFYFSPATGRLIGILNYDNADQWAKDQIKIPILAYCDFEAYPLADYDEYVKNAMAAWKASLKAMSAAAK